MSNELKEVLQSVLKDALEPVHKELQSLNARVSNIETTQKSLREEIQAIKENTEHIPLIKRAVLETSDAVKHLKEIQDRQFRVIDLLSARSIQHEAELRRKQ